MFVLGFLWPRLGRRLGSGKKNAAARTESECCDAKGLLVVADDALRVLHVDRMIPEPRASLRYKRGAC